MPMNILEIALTRDESTWSGNDDQRAVSKDGIQENLILVTGATRGRRPSITRACRSTAAWITATSMVLPPSTSLVGDSLAR
jgi:hypothetical protein